MLNCTNSTIKTKLRYSAINCDNHQTKDTFTSLRFPLEEKR